MFVRKRYVLCVKSMFCVCALLPVVRKPIFSWPVVFQLWIIVKRKKKMYACCVCTLLPVVRKPIFPWPVVFQLWIIVKRKKEKKNVSVLCVLSFACLFVLSCLFIYVINQQFLACFDEDKKWGWGKERGRKKK